MQLHVDTELSADGMPMPRRIRFNGRQVDVWTTVDQWHGSGYRYVKAIGNDGGTYILRFDEARGTWELTMFARKGIG